MPLSCRVTALAKSDILDIGTYIARDNVEAAIRVIDRIEARFAMLARQPLIGELRDEIREGLRSFPVGNYVIYYQTAGTDVTIVRVLHAARDVGRLF
jgi:toxin ParE1/3/4